LIPSTLIPSLDIVIVNWNAGALLQPCLDSIASAIREGFELSRVVVVDNASSDGSATNLRPESIPLFTIHNAVNLGFAAACNQGGRGSRASYLLFLNPDTVLASNSLSTAARFMESKRNSQVAVCGLQLVDDQGKIAASCSRFPRPRHFYAHMFGLNHLFPRRFQNSLMQEWDHGDTRAVDIVMGALLLVRREVFEALGGFDERFFVYYEEVDFLYSVQRAGWKSFYLNTAQAYHKGGACSSRSKAMRLFYSLRSRIIYGYKHFGRASATAVALGTLLVEPFSRLAYAAVRGSVQEIGDTFKAYAILWPWLAASLLRPSRWRAATADDGTLATDPDPR
jgi:N-acetylglucosaminyl-diphospho-decaprenol L-rhamnosyltransferase